MRSANRFLVTAVGLASVLLATAAPALANHAPGTSCTPGRAVRYDNETWLNTPGYQYRIIVSSFPSDLSSSEQVRDRTMARIRDGIRAWNQGRNDCHLRRFGGFNTSMTGTSGSSGGDHLDGISTIDFASPSNLGCSDFQGFLLGCASVRQLAGAPPVTTKAGVKERAREADVRFRREDNIWRVRRRTRGCSDRYDLWSLSAHEIGHVVGLNDLSGTGEAYQTLYQSTAQCDFDKRQLGRGDYIGLKRMYTPGP
jgi:hypothetical protein